MWSLQISDHFVVSIDISLPRCSFAVKQIEYRNYRSVDLKELKRDICNSPLHRESDWLHPELDELAHLYDSTLSAIVEKQAPLKQKTMIIRPVQPWVDE